MTRCLQLCLILSFPINFLWGAATSAYQRDPVRVFYLLPTCAIHANLLLHLGGKMLYNFKVGDKVRWVSYAAGKWTEKIGVIVEIVPPQRGVVLDKYRGKYNLSPFSKGNPRLHTSYVVAVPVGKGKPKLYWPRANQLEPIKE